MIPYNHSTHEPCKSERHAGQELVTINGFTFPADKEMVPLLKSLNAAGIQTYSHCGGHHPTSDHAWVVIELEGVDVRVRNHLKRSQMVLTWKPLWLAKI